MGEEPAVCPQLHLPLQSASNRVLERMERGYTIEKYDALVGRIRAAVPGIELSTDIIVGFPGETEADFLETCAYIEATGFDQAFQFAYSPRDGTKAARWDDAVDAGEGRRRLREVIALQEQIVAARSAAWVGRTVEVLVEGAARRPEGWLVGKTREFRTAVFPAGDLRPGDIAPVLIGDSTAHTLIGAVGDAPELELASLV